MKKVIYTFAQVVYVKRKDFDNFIFPEFQREQGKSHINKIGKSVFEIGGQRLIVVSLRKNGKMAVLDGGHLLKAVINSDTPEIPVLMNRNLTFEQERKIFMKLNTVRKNFNLRTHITSFRHLIDYKNLLSAISWCPLQETVIGMALSQNASRTGMTKNIKEGTFKVKNFKAGKRMLQQIVECNTIIPSTRQNNEALVKLMIEQGGNYNHKLFTKRLKTRKMEVMTAKTEADILSVLHQIHDNERVLQRAA